MITYNLNKLIRRKLDISKILSPLKKSIWGPNCGLRINIDSVIIYTYDGLNPSDSDYRNLSFTTFVRPYTASYYEIWLKEKENIYRLEKAYLNLYKISSSQNEQIEYLCLHCDPNSNLNDKKNIYKVGPHLHISTAEYPVSKSHIALNRCHIEEILVSAQTLTRALKYAILMIREEILDKI